MIDWLVLNHIKKLTRVWSLEKVNFMHDFRLLLHNWLHSFVTTFVITFFLIKNDKEKNGKTFRKKSFYALDLSRNADRCTQIIQVCPKGPQRVVSTSSAFFYADDELNPISAFSYQNTVCKDWIWCFRAKRSSSEMILDVYCSKVKLLHFNLVL